MFKQKRRTMLLSSLLVLVLLVLAGCQPVGGLDVNKVLTNSFSVKSAESNQTITLELTPDNTGLSPQAQKMFDLFGKMKLTVTDAKTEDRFHASMKGTLEYAKGQIPFQLAMDDQQLTLQIEGAKKPLVLRTGAAALGSAEMPSPLSKALQEEIDKLSKRMVESAPSLASFVTRSFPNPNAISVENVSEKIHGESVNLQKLHAEVRGSELIDLVKGFLTNVLADEKGLKEFIGGLYDVYSPFLLAMAKEAGELENDPMTDMIMPYLQNKTLAVEFVFTFLKTQLEQALSKYDASVAAYFATEEGAATKAWLGGQYVKVDLYVDRDGMTRKSVTELMITAPEGKADGLKSVKVTSSAEMWNINKPVKADKVDTSAGVIELNGTTGRITPSKIVASLEPNSQLYKLLKNDLQITKKEITMLMNDNGNDYGFFGTKPYNDNGTVMVPVRFVVERLDADVEWDAATNLVKVTDPLKGTVITLTIGSTTATVNGTPQTLEKAAVLVDGTTYIPVRFVTENMGAEVKWNQETQTVSITRD
ncbi:copper amine oxidase N-terminal domain-containing protein [Paenibacillus allorhizosphaerae]|uniref:Copper amine oxidase-like N-terminal domain-containing protein n=1 Tax=Paenibacillus allorhizosphaerae TaxID=2849866 RepID=A0ABM8VKJ3_9BACL|nr:copper amine oxidase N-terminal domain-containing protein [Paenibacillus allorhizosphaerae]CAG7647235.1 hypothetical protein PAECIP111802_03923 [Paenibacillus allorhizosphaerae]